jgi:hypothetical protein
VKEGGTNGSECGNKACGVAACRAGLRGSGGSGRARSRGSRGGGRGATAAGGGAAAGRGAWRRGSGAGSAAEGRDWRWDGYVGASSSRSDLEVSREERPGEGGVAQSKVVGVVRDVHHPGELCRLEAKLVSDTQGISGSVAHKVEAANIRGGSAVQGPGENNVDALSHGLEWRVYGLDLSRDEGRGGSKKGEETGGEVDHLYNFATVGGGGNR